MEAITLLLTFLTVSGYSHVLQPRLTFFQIAGLHRDHQSEMRSEQLRDSSVSVEEKEKDPEAAERRKTEEGQGTEGMTPDTNPEKKRIEEEITASFSRNIGEILDSSREGYSIADMLKDLDTGEVERREDEPNLETNEKSKTVKGNTKTWETVKAVDSHKGNETLENFKESDQRDKRRHELVEEERESKLVTGISLHVDTRGDVHEDGEKILIVDPKNVAEQGGNEENGHNIKNANPNELVGRENRGHVANLTPPLSTSSQLGKGFEIPATIQIITQPQNPPSSPPVHHHNVTVSSHPPVPDAKASPHYFPPSVTLPNPTAISHISVSTAAPGEARSVLLLEDVLTEVLQSLGHHLKQNEAEVKVSPNLEDVLVKNILFKPTRKELQTTRDINTVVQPHEAEFIPEAPTEEPRPKETKFITKDLKTKQPNPTSKSNENNLTANPVELTREADVTQPTGKPETAKLMENDTKVTVRKNKASPPQPQTTKPSSRPQLATANTPPARPTKINRSSKNKTIKKSKEKRRKKGNKTQKPSEKKEVITPMHFPYFMDNYCPPECACYGRVVQCSDKSLDKVPYGIPYNSRYILLMNNHINSIQLDLLNEYVSMEFLVLSNNRLTDGAIEGAFEGVPALKRLYLDRNLLESVPTDLPVSLEELRLDNNHLSVMSEVAWARSPSLLVLSLSNNTLGKRSESLSNAVLFPLCSLRTLNLNHNQLSSVPLGLPLSIKELFLKGNLIEQFRGGAFDGMSELLVLDLSANRLTNKGLLRESLLNATHLESLNLEGNRLKQVPRHLPHSLKTLNLEGNLISSIKKVALGTLKNLEHLGLARNKIFKVAPGAFSTLTVLHQLDLCHNTLHQVPRKLPQALHSVALTHNKIQSVPRDAFCWGNKSLSGLVRVQLEHNFIDMGKLDAQAFRCLRGFQVVHFY